MRVREIERDQHQVDIGRERSVIFLILNYYGQNIFCLCAFHLCHGFLNVSSDRYWMQTISRLQFCRRLDVVDRSVEE